jgi:bla regulator protein BlaR1
MSLLPAALHFAAPLLPSALTLVRQLAHAALMGTLFVLAVWLLCRLAPRLPAGLRCALWWLASMKLLLGLAWLAPPTLPLLPPTATTAAAWLLASPPTPALPPAPSPAAAEPWWALAVAGLWLAGVLRQAALTTRELRLVRRFLERSAPISDQPLLALAADLRGRLGMKPVALRASPAGAVLAAPLTAGALHPVVVLPAGFDRLSRQELAMTLGHELLHVRRRDLLWGWIPAAAARLFFFLPPAALAAREYDLARETACDAAVLRLLGATPASYGRLLLRLGVRAPFSRRQSHRADLAPAAATAGGAAASVRQLKKRLEMLQHHLHDAPPRRARLRRLGFALLAFLALAALVPLRIVTAAPAGRCPRAGHVRPNAGPPAGSTRPAKKEPVAEAKGAGQRQGPRRWRSPAGGESQDPPKAFRRTSA